MKHLMVVILGLVLFTSGTSYAGDETAKCSANEVTKSADKKARKKLTLDEKAINYEKAAARYDARAVKFAAKGKTAEAAILKKLAEAKRALAKAYASGDKKQIKAAHSAFKVINKEYKATDYYKAVKAKRDAKKLAKK